MKQISIDGRIGKNAEVLTTKGGKQYIRFSLANNSFANGSEKTEWFDITSYDPYIVENRAKYLTKGKYVIIHGSLTSEVAVKNGKVWLNQYVNATTIDTPSFGAKKEGEEDEAQETLSTYTATTKTETVKQEPKPVVKEEQIRMEVMPTQEEVSNLSFNMDDDDEMPF